MTRLASGFPGLTSASSSLCPSRASGGIEPDAPLLLLLAMATETSCYQERTDLGFEEGLLLGIWMRGGLQAIVLGF